MRSVVTGGAGFIGSHLVRVLAAAGDEVVVYDRKNGDEISNTERLIAACQGADRIYHLASNADIAASAKDPTIDFYEGTFLTQRVLEAARIARVHQFVYASGSGVYGEMWRGDEFTELWPLSPVSTYGASKVAGEALTAAYGEMFEMNAAILRFANVVGSGQTHGVGYDFIRKLRADPSRLEILGDGRQSKPFLHVDDAVSALLMGESPPFHILETVNVAPTTGWLTVTEIAEMACKALGLDPNEVEFDYSGGKTGWVGDVPTVRMNVDRLLGFGWKPRHTSHEAMTLALEALANEHR